MSALISNSKEYPSWFFIIFWVFWLLLSVFWGYFTLSAKFIQLWVLHPDLSSNIVKIWVLDRALTAKFVSKITSLLSRKTKNHFPIFVALEKSENLFQVSSYVLKYHLYGTIVAPYNDVYKCLVRAKTSKLWNFFKM